MAGSYRTVLVGTDGSDTSFRAVDRAATLAADAGAQLLVGPVRYTRRQAAARAGVPLDQASELWHALGFASVADDETAFTDGDVTALANAARLVAAGLVDEAALGTVTRMVGQTMSRLA